MNLIQLMEEIYFNLKLVSLIFKYFSQVLRLQKGAQI